jgi:hypothetical protein
LAERDSHVLVSAQACFLPISQNGMAEIALQINRVYRKADYVGSMVVGRDTSGSTEQPRPNVEPPTWWDEFWRRHFTNSGQKCDEAMAMLN